MKIGINGLGRIGRLALRAAIEQDITVAAINTSADLAQLAHLIKYDSTHMQAPFDVQVGDNCLHIGKQQIAVMSQKDVSKIDWDKHQITALLECSGRLNTKELASQHQGKAKIIVSSPCAGADATIVLGANQDELKQNMRIISIGSCTTNALAPVVKILDEHLKIVAGYATTVHAYTFDQNLLDNFHSDLRRSRAAAGSIIPTKSGVSSALKLVLPHVADKISGSALRVPTANVSLIDFSFQVATPTSKEHINSLFEDFVSSGAQNILSIAKAPLVSCDFNHTTFSSIFDPFETSVINKHFARILCWYDNEWAFTMRMLDVAKLFAL
jgi:glyceraldehyde 3-phosphate dehydrogenase